MGKRAYNNVSELHEDLLTQDYVASTALATVLYLALKLNRPLFLEGEAGVGKTEIAKVLSQLTGGELIRLQCYEGLDISQAVYEWNYSAQMLHIRMLEASGRLDKHTHNANQSIFDTQFLIERPVLKAMRAHSSPPVLLIDELDRADEAFEAYLLEALSDFQVSIPEIGAIKAQTPPIVIITSNRTREIHDALKRRCLYHWVDYPSLEAEMEILHRKLPHIKEEFTEKIVRFIQRLRDEDIFKAPGVAETLDWAQALIELDQISLDPDVVNDTLGVVLKYQDDIAKTQGSKARKIIDELQGLN